jgi:hypothetical protein
MTKDQTCKGVGVSPQLLKLLKHQKITIKIEIKTEIKKLKSKTQIKTLCQT